MDKKILTSFLDNQKNLGLGLDKRSAQKIADKIFDIIQEIKKLEKDEEQMKIGPVKDNNGEVKDIRQYLFETFDVKIHNFEQLRRVNQFIKQRLENKIDSMQFIKLLDNTYKEGGANIDTRIASKLGRRLELLILGKFKV